MKWITRGLIFVFMVVFTGFLTSDLFAQTGYGYLEDEGDSLWQEEEFMDATGLEYQTQDSQYVSEEEIKAAQAAARKAGLPTVDLAAAIEQDRELMPDNIIYGIGTGALIGGWLALVQGESARDNVRFLSVGVVSGILLGLAVGTKSLYLRDTPVASSPGGAKPTPARSLADNQPPFRFDLVRAKNQPAARLSYHLRF